MSIFGSIMSAIFGNAHGFGLAGAAGRRALCADGILAIARCRRAQVDVAEVLDDLEDESDEEDLDWRHSIVDLMKLLKLDSSLTARKTLATELGYTGNMGDSASMNIWLHKQVMTKLAENGGKVPADLH